MFGLDNLMSGLPSIGCSNNANDLVSLLLFNVANFQQTLESLRNEFREFKLTSKASEFCLESAITGMAEEISKSKTQLSAEISELRLLSQEKKMEDQTMAVLEQKLAASKEVEEKAKRARWEMEALKMAEINALTVSLEKAKQAVLEVELKRNAEVTSLKAALENAIALKKRSEQKVSRLTQEIEGFKSSAETPDSAVVEADESYTSPAAKLHELKSLLRASEESLEKMKKENDELQEANENLEFELKNIEEIYPEFMEAKNDIIRAALSDEYDKVRSYCEKFQKPPMINILNTRDAETGDTPLLSVWRYPMSELLIHRGADLEATNRKGETAAINKARRDLYLVLRELTIAGANLRAKDLRGNTALMAAAECGWYRIVEYLLEYAPNNNTPDDECDAACQIAIENGRRQKLVDLLLQYRFNKCKSITN